MPAAFAGLRMSGMLTCQRDLFSLPPQLHYLNCGYMSPLPRPVEQAGFEGMRRKRVPSRITSDDFFTESDEVRGLFAKLVNVPDPQRIAIIPAASYGIAAAVRNTAMRPGQNVVVAAEQFPGNVYAWLSRCRREGLDLRTVHAPPGPARGEGWTARILEAIDRSTAAVALGHVHWTDGTRFDLLRIGERARACGAAFIVDGTQSVGALPFDVQEVRPDALICAAYKWLLGPYSIGVAYFGPRFDEGTPLEETWIARRDSEDFAGLVDYRDDYQPGAVRYDVGERSNFILVPMLAAALRLLDGWRAHDIQAYCHDLTRELVAEAQAVGFTVEDAAWRGAHLFGLRAAADLSMDSLSDRLRERNVIVSRRGSAIRISPHLYNDADDIAVLTEALRQAGRR